MLNEVIKQYIIVCKLKLLFTFNERFIYNLKNAFTENGEYVFKNIRYEFQKFLNKIDQKSYSFIHNELR